MPRPERPHHLSALALNLIYDAGGVLDYGQLLQSYPAHQRKLVSGVVMEQHALGNVRRDGEAVVLTASARAAIGAGRAHRAEAA